MPDEQPEAKPWFQSAQIRVALAIIVVPALTRIAQHTILGQWLAEYLGIDILTMKAEDLVNWLMLAISAVGSVIWIKHRVDAGKDPRSCAPEIIPPKIVQRLSGNTPVVKDEFSEIAKDVAKDPILTKDVPFIDPVKAREEVNDLAEMIRRDAKFRERLNHAGTGPKEGGK